MMRVNDFCIAFMGSEVRVDDREFEILSRSDLLETQKEEIGKVLDR